MHKLEALWDQLTDGSELGDNLLYFTYLSEEVDKFPKCLELGLIERAQEREHHQLLRLGALKLDDLQERRTMIIGHCCELWRRKELIDTQFVRPLFGEDFLEHDLKVILRASCIHRCPQLPL